jgi:hypothetical protein
MKTRSLHMQANNGVSTNMGIQFNSNILLNKCINTISNEIAREFQRQSIVTVTITLNSEFLINNENRLASDE